MHTLGPLRHTLRHSLRHSLRHLGKISHLAAVTTLGFSSASALADPSPALDRLNFSVGGYYVDPTFNLSGNTRYGAVNSGDIDRNRTTLPRVRAELLLWDSQGLSFDYFTYRKTYSGSFDRTIPSATTPVSAAMLKPISKSIWPSWLISGGSAMAMTCSVSGSVPAITARIWMPMPAPVSTVPAGP